jgi:stage II sporulation protein E
MEVKMIQDAVSKKRWILQAVVGFMLGRVWLFSMNPFAIAYICASGVYPGSRMIVLCSVLAGVLTKARGLNFIQYIVLIGLTGFVQYVMKKIDGKEGSVLAVACVCGVLNFVFGITMGVLSTNMKEAVWMSLLESLCMIALANVFQWGVRFLLYEDWEKILRNEELISAVSLAALAVYGMPRLFEGVFSIVETLSYLLVLFVGYRYGAASGAMAGAAGGILAAATGGGMVLVGVYCLLGIGIGIFREIGRVISTAAFLLMGIIMAYVIRNEVLGIVELRGMVSAAIIFLSIPGSVIRTIESDLTKNQENPFAKEDLKTLANYKIDGLTMAFRRLAKSFSDFTERERRISGDEMEEIFDELSGKVCRECINCHYCWEANYEETYENIRNILAAASEQGVVETEGINEKFCSRCLRLEEYIEKINERMAIARMNLSWRNKMVESREAMANQMLEIAGALKDFTLELNETVEVPVETKKKVLFALRSLGIHVKNLSFKTDQRGNLEICFVAKARGNACITKKDVAIALEHVLDMRMTAGRYVRNVIPKEYEAVAFVQDTNFKALTGLARVAKSGETVSGDNFSFMELSTGELVMVLSDGMGSGAGACRDSENLVEVLESLIEAGFQKESAIRLINTLFVMSYEGKKFTTLDMTAIDLYSGNCEIVKNGAAATFIKRDSGVETIFSKTLPVGIDMEAQPESTRTSLSDGDIVVMVSDGIVDAFPGENKEFYVENILENMNTNNPSDIANGVLMQALSRNAKEASDDMSVLVAGVWDK